MRQPAAGIITHAGQVVYGTPKIGDPVTVSVDTHRRKDIMRNHTATHLLHAALHEILGNHARQAGSLVAPDRLRFDFTHSEAVTPGELEQIESLVNEVILANNSLQVSQKTLDEALAGGAIALFGEKYGNEVRNITIGGPGLSNSKTGGQRGVFSNELCGGTHLDRTGDVGTFIITSEGSAAAGIRRIEAITGREAYRLIQRRFRVINQAAAVLSTTPEEILEKAQTLLSNGKEMRSQIASLRNNLAAVDFARVLDETANIGGVEVLTAQLNDAGVESLRQMADHFRQRHPENGVAVLASVINDRPTIIAAVTDDLVKRGLKAGDLAGFVARQLGGGGGGKPTLAQAGGRDASKLGEALGEVSEWVAGKLK